jgi:glycosyltransferase involved in cell wall biosynthesis
VRPRRPAQLAHLIEEHREELRKVASELMVGVGGIPAELGDRLTALADDRRLLDVESTLRHSVYDRLPRWLRRALGWLRSWTRPRIGLLRHHGPKALRLPAGYLRTSPPTPAPVISIVTPSFQQGRFLARTLQSVISQGYPALEYVVRDGGSTDETVEVLERFDASLTYWQSKPDDGQADAINRAFERTSGEIMAWINSDDILLPGALAYVARYFDEHPDVDVVYGHRVMIDEFDRKIGEWILPPHDDKTLTFADYVPQETLFWRRRIWEAAGGFVDPALSFAVDWDLLLRFREAGGKIVRLPRFLGAFRVHADQKTTVDHEIGRAECDRLRQRVHGRSVPIEEVGRLIRPYLLRHMVSDLRWRSARLLPGRRFVLEPVPVDRSLERKPPHLPSVVDERPPPSLTSPLTAARDSAEEERAGSVPRGS